MLHIFANAPKISINMLDAFGLPLSFSVEPSQMLSELVMSAFRLEEIYKE